MESLQGYSWILTIQPHTHLWCAIFLLHVIRVATYLSSLSQIHVWDSVCLAILSSCAYEHVMCCCYTGYDSTESLVWTCCWCTYICHRGCCILHAHCTAFDASRDCLVNMFLRLLEFLDAVFLAHIVSSRPVYLSTFLLSTTISLKPSSRHLNKGWDKPT